MTTATCHLCDGPVELFCCETVLGRHPATYERCGRCGFVQASNPDWLAEAYLTPINPMDTGCVARTWHFSRATAAVIGTVLRADGPFLDYGGGYGLFVRHMRDQGFDFRWMDGYCRNLLAAGFEADPTSDRRYGLITAFEVFEHLTDPWQKFEELFRWSDAVLFSTELMSPNLSRLAGWHFAGLEHGQHVAFFTPQSLRFVAGRLGVHLASNGHSLHLLSRRRVSPAWFRLLSNRRIAALTQPLWRRPSLILSDTQHMEATLRRQHEAKK